MILSQHARPTIELDPFPHLVIHDVLDAGLAAQLTQSFPPLPFFTGGRRFPDCTKRHYSGSRIMRDQKLSPALRDFMRDNLQQQLLERLLELFGDTLYAQYPQLDKKLGNPHGWKIGVRYQDDFERADALLDCQLSLHTPTYGSTPAADRGPHIKMTDKLFVGHLFLRQPDDNSRGGDLEMFSLKPGAQPRFGRDNVTDRSQLQLHKTVPFTNNTLVFWLNSPTALQGFAPHAQGDSPMTYVNFFVGLEHALFELPRTPVTRLRNLAGALRYRFTSPRQQILRFGASGDQ